MEMAWAAKYEGQTGPICGDGTPTPDQAISRETCVDLQPRNDVRVALKAAAPALMPAS